jgi:predicted MPP superfamily phosphohydrolase
MPRICVTSDLHVGITPEADIIALVSAIAAEQPDLTILAGDVGEGPTAYRCCLALFADLPGQLGAVPGNHDLWRREGRRSERL